MKKKINKVNFINDLGNIKTTNGIKIKKGCLYRSSALTKINDKSIKKINDRIGLGRIFDLRSPSELIDKPEVMIEGTKYYSLSPLNDFDNPAITKNNRMKVLKELSKKEGGTKHHLEGIYRKLISSEQALESYKGMLREIIDNPKETTVWHCTQGKDRTGIGSAIILLALGVNKEDIIKDYLKYNRSCKYKNFFIFLGMSVLYLRVRLAKSLMNLLKARREYIEAAFDEINVKFGSIENYFRNGLDLSSDDIEKLRIEYLM